MEDEATLFHDHSTLPGKLSLFFHRLNWKYLIPPFVFLVAFSGIAILIASVEGDLRKSSASHAPLQLAPGNSLLGAEDPALDGIGTDIGDTPGWTTIKQTKPGEFEAEGCENGLYPFEGFGEAASVGASMKSLKLRDLVIDAATLSKALVGWTSLETIIIENVWVDGNFSRVYLPNLNKFIFHQFRNGKTDAYKLPVSLREILFFDKSPTGSWDLEKDLINLNMTIQLTIEGTKILDIEPDNGDITINTHFCEDIIKNFHSDETFPLTSLSLHWCSVGNATLDKLYENGGNLRFLFLNNAVPYSSDDWNKITTSLKNLQELHVFLRFKCDWPGYEIFLNVSNLSPTVETLSVTNLDLSFETGAPATSVKSLSLDMYVGDNIVTYFSSIFPNVESVGIFNVTQNRTYPLLHQVLHVKPELVIVTNLTRLGSQPRNKVNMPKSRKPQAGNAIIEVEKTLDLAGIPKDATCFLLERSKNNNTYVGKVLSAFQKNFYRYKRLAFYKVDTYADYVTWDADPA